MVLKCSTALWIIAPWASPWWIQIAVILQKQHIKYIFSFRPLQIEYLFPVQIIGCGQTLCTYGITEHSLLQKLIISYDEVLQLLQIK